MVERFIAPVLKTGDPQGSVGSNPTPSAILSPHPIKEIYGVVETPETSGLIPTAAMGVNAGPKPPGEFNPSSSSGHERTSRREPNSRHGPA